MKGWGELNIPYVWLLMSRKGITSPRMLSEKMGVTYGTCHRMLNRKTSPSLPTIRALATVLECPIPDLMIVKRRPDAPLPFGS